MDKILKVCSSCGATHTQVSFTDLTNPVDDKTKYYTCPITRDPILVSDADFEAFDDMPDRDDLSPSEWKDAINTIVNS